MSILTIWGSHNHATSADAAAKVEVMREDVVTSSFAMQSVKDTKAGRTFSLQTARRMKRGPKHCC